MSSQQTNPFVHKLQTSLTNVKDIPYFVSNKFMRTYYRDRYQLAQVERMVEGAYENYLVKECKKQKSYRSSLESEARRKASPEEQERALREAREFELTRCFELDELFPQTNSKCKIHSSNQERVDVVSHILLKSPLHTNTTNAKRKRMSSNPVLLLTSSAFS